MVKIMQIVIRNKNPHVENCITSIEEYDSFEEYLNLMAVERIKMPFFFKNITRSYNIEKKEVLSEIYDPINKVSYNLFGKVIKENHNE